MAIKINIPKNSNLQKQTFSFTSGIHYTVSEEDNKKVVRLKTPTFNFNLTSKFTPGKFVINGVNTNLSSIENYEIKRNTNVTVTPVFIDKSNFPLDHYARDCVAGYTSAASLSNDNLSDLTNITPVADASYAFSGCADLTDLNGVEETWNTENITNASYMFDGCSNIDDLDFSNWDTSGFTNTSYMFQNCSSLSDISSMEELDFGNVTNMNYMFSGCTSLTSVSFPEIGSISTSGLNNTFRNCTNLTSISFPKLDSVSTSFDLFNNTFYGCSSLEEIHFRYDVKTSIMSLSSYNNKYGISDVAIYFDLATARVTISPNVSDYNLYFEGAEASNPLPMIPGEANTYYVYKDGYCLYLGSKTPLLSDSWQNLTENITLTTAGYKTTFNITLPEHTKYATTDLIVKFNLDGINFKTITLSSINTNTTQIVDSIIVPANTEISYTIEARGYKKINNVAITPTNDTLNITLEILTAEILDFSYPFTENSEYLANLIDDNNFTIFDNTKTPASCIVSGAKSYNKSNGFSSGYIEFTTPDTDETEFLTLSVTCTNNAESRFDWGVVFINTSGTMPTSNVSFTTGAGSTDSTYGDVLFQGCNNQSSTFRTVTKVLAADTTYYLGFYYRKDSSVNSGWDRFAIQNIKLPVASVNSSTLYTLNEIYDDLNGSGVDDPTLSYEGWIIYKRTRGNTTLQSLNGTFTTSNNININNITESTYSSGNNEYIQVNFWISFVDQEQGNYNYTITYTPGQHSGVTFSENATINGTYSISY